MKNKEITKKLNVAFKSITPNNYDEIKSKIKKKEGTIYMEEKIKKIKPSIAFGTVFASIALFVILGIILIRPKLEFAKISIDVNPSIELSINNNQKVLSANYNNEDGKKILEGMDLEGSSLNVATNAIIGSMVTNGYISELKNSLLITVKGDNETKNEEIRKNIVEDIDNIVKNYNIEGSIISQVLDNDNEIKRLSETYNISEGKVKIINRLIESNSLYTFESLSHLNINELNLLIDSNKTQDNNIIVVGNASDKEYIGDTKAKEIAFKDANAKATNINNLNIELDLEDRIMVYEIEFTYNNREYDYEINATTGVIIKSSIEKDDDTYDFKETDKDDDYDDDELIQTSNKKTYISKTQAKEIALNHSKVTNPLDYSIEFEYNAGIPSYEIEFESNNMEYEYLINAETGKIINSHQERDN